MSTATAEKPKTAEAPKAAEAEAPATPPYVMPKVRVGQLVRFYRYGERNPEHPPEIAFVVKPGRNLITYLKTIDGIPLQGVAHIDSPRLKENAALKAEGAWDYTEEEVEQRRINADLLARVTALEEALKKK